MKMLFFIPFILLFGKSCDNKVSEQSTNHSGLVVKIYDGDTYEILMPDKTVKKIRMEGIDAPEKGMPFYSVSKKYLGTLCFQQEVNLTIKGTDRYNRTIARAYLKDGRELSEEMVRAGYAWHFIKYSQDVRLDSLEKIARAEKAGLWVDARPMAPWENRRLHRKGISTKDSFSVAH